MAQEFIEIGEKIYCIVRELPVHQFLLGDVDRFLVVRVKGGRKLKYATVPTRGESFVNERGIVL
jgi:hypothetical protein